MMEKLFKVLKVVFVLLFIALLIGNVSKGRKIDKLKESRNAYKQEVADADEIIGSLKSELKTANERIVELEQQSIAGTEDNTYINAKFPSDGNYYKEAFDQVTFYSDITCTSIIRNVRFMSPAVDSSYAQNGLAVYCLRMDNGEICYCTDSPYLITESKYNEMQAEEE